MGMVRTQLLLPDRLLREIDSAVGKKGRSAFFAKIARKALQEKDLNGTLASQDRRDVLAAQKSLKSKVRIPWSVVKQSRKTG